MEKELVRRNPLTLWSTAAIAAIIGIGLIAIFPPHETPPSSATLAGTDNATSTAPSTVATTSGSPAPAVGQSKPTGGSNVPIVPGPTITIHLLTPIANNVWTIGGQNPIAWDNAAGVTGEIELVNATTKEFVGVILSETGPNQTSYSWNARSIYLGRYSADEVDVVPGTYSILIHFDGNGLGDLISGPITITN